MGAEEDGSVQYLSVRRCIGPVCGCCSVSARPCRAGVLNAEPGGGRASGAAQRRDGSRLAAGRQLSSLSRGLATMGAHVRGGGCPRSGGRGGGQLRVTSPGSACRFDTNAKSIWR